LLDTSLIPAAQTGESKVFLLQNERRLPPVSRRNRPQGHPEKQCPGIVPKGYSKLG